jgi:DNA-binding CsgD family transcriptional regulator
VLVGREAELIAVDEFLLAVRRSAAALVLEGEPGIGKTTLWQAAADRARDRGMLVLASRPGPSETRLTFAGLADLVAGLDDKVYEQLPAPQRNALGVALLQVDSKRTMPDLRSLSTSFLSLLRILARSGPVVVALDDVQWLDAPSWQIVEFAFRRLDSEPVGLLAAERLEAGLRPRLAAIGELPSGRLRRLRVGPLSLSSIHDMIAARLGSALARPVLVRIQQTSAGNPFFALELARAIVDMGGEPLGSGGLPVPGNLLELIARRLRPLPPATREALLEAASLSPPTTEIVDPMALAPAEDAGVVSIDRDGRVAFTHPMLASAVYSLALPARRRAVHRLLAKRVNDEEARARHLALASEVPDEEAAAALADAARSARTRGAPGAAIELMELACQLTPAGEPARRLERKLELGRHLAASGDPERAVTVLNELTGEAGPGRLRAHARILLAYSTEGLRGSEAAMDICERALADAVGDPELGAEIHAMASRLSDHDTDRKRNHAREALDLATSCEPHPALSAFVLLAGAEARFRAGEGLDHALFEQAAREEGATGTVSMQLWERHPCLLHVHSELDQTARLLAILQIHADELDAARAQLVKDLKVSEDLGDEAQLARTLTRLATVEVKVGDWPLAERHFERLADIIDQPGRAGVRRWALAIRAEFHALKGRVEEARADLAVALDAERTQDNAWETARSLAVRGFLELSLGSLESARADFDAVEEIESGIGLQEPRLLRHQANRIETLGALGRLDDANVALAVLERRGEATGGAWAQAVAGRCRGLLSAAAGDLDPAVAALDGAVVAHERLPIPFELGRTLLVKGQIHRRRKEKVRAREALEESIAIFERLGASLWLARAQTELGRVGLRHGSPDQMTPTEKMVAQLAASGLTNREIAERVFLSPKTVESNLGRVYEKLGVHSRAALGARMATLESLARAEDS